MKWSLKYTRFPSKFNILSKPDCKNKIVKNNDTKKMKQLLDEASVKLGASDMEPVRVNEENFHQDHVQYDKSMVDYEIRPS